MNIKKCVSMPDWIYERIIQHKPSKVSISEWVTMCAFKGSELSGSKDSSTKPDTSFITQEFQYICRNRISLSSMEA